jgi:hypothetical protein
MNFKSPPGRSAAAKRMREPAAPPLSFDPMQYKDVLKKSFIKRLRKGKGKKNSSGRTKAIAGPLGYARGGQSPYGGFE